MPVWPEAFSHYLGPDTEDWQQYDASALVRTQRAAFAQGILIDPGLDDQFLAEQLMQQQFEAACSDAKQPLTLRRHAGYDHGYYFISTFIEDHLAFHHATLNA